MTGLYVSFLIVGVILFIGSFIFVQKLTSSDIEEIKKLSEQELQVLIDTEFKKKEAELTLRLTERADTAFDDFEKKSDHELTEKILEIQKFVDEMNAVIQDKSEPLVSVIDESHKEIIFMYDRLNEKQEKLTAMTDDLKKMETELRYLKDGISDLLKKIEEEKLEIDVSAAKEAALSEPDASPENAASLSEMQGELLSMREELEQKFNERLSDMSEKLAEQAEESQKKSPEELQKERQEEILRMKNEGFSEIEIAKKMEIGLGEVKLILGLFQ